MIENKGFVRGAAIVAALAAGALALSAGEASAQWRRGYGYGPGAAVAAGVLGGVAAGAIIANSARPYPPGPVYYDYDAPPPPPPRCWFEPEDVWNGYRWVRRNVRVCE